MILWSTQWKIVNDISLSFMKHKKIHTKRNEMSMQRDKYFLNPNKFSTYTESDFKFLVLYTCLSSSSKISVLKKLQSYQEDELKEINKIKSDIINFNYTFQQDIHTMKVHNMSYDAAVSLYNNKKISILGLWWYLKDKALSGRIKNKYKDKIMFFMSYFEKITDNLEQFETKN